MRTLHMLHSLDCEVGEVGTTVRRGTKWNDAVDQEVELCACGLGDQHAVKGHASVFSAWTGSFSNVPARLIEREHEARSRRYPGLLVSMRKAYGEDFSESETVTVLSYKRLD
jgi:hypothetical protein